MRKLLGALCVVTAFVIGAPAMAAITVVGTPNTGNCYPFLCNDTGASTGLVMDYEQVYSSTAFSGPTYIFSATGVFDQADGGTGYELGGSYNVYLGYAAQGSVNNLSTDLASNFLTTPFLVFSYSIPDNYININPTGTIGINGPGGNFLYDPSVGDLLLEIQVFNQQSNPNPNGHGYLLADDTGAVTSRAYCGANIGCVADSTGLVIAFQTSGADGGTTGAPEPASIALLSSGLFLVRRRKKTV